MRHRRPSILLSLSLLAGAGLGGCSRAADPAPAEAPKAEAPKAEAPKAEAQKADPAPAEAQKAEAQKAGAAGAVTATEPYERAFGDGWIAAGQPSEARLEALVEARVPIISLRTPGEDPFDEAALVSRLGGTFARHPTTGAEFTQPAYREALFDAFDQHAKAGGPVYVHCASSNRVGAAWALYLAERRGVSAEQALEQGRAAGLRGLEGLVRSILQGG